ncbi:MAG: hypothetical protein IJR93_12910 [Treponema sp.]|nr:hypothetical protein [Treponema sp.]
MTLKRLAACIAAASVLALGVAAQDDWDDWDDISGSDSSEDGFDSFGDDGFGDEGFGDDSFGSFDDDFGGGSSSGGLGGLPITFSGRLTFDGRYYFAKDDSKYFKENLLGDLTGMDSADMDSLQNRKLTTMIRWGDSYPYVEDPDETTDAYFDSLGYEKVNYADNTLKAFPAARLGIGYSGSKADANLVLNLTEDTLRHNQIDIIDELILRGYFIDNRLTVEAGKMKVVWGKGDKLHVLDNFNADDYTDFIIPDYIDRRISTPMLRAVYSFNTEMPFTVEALWTPFLPVDRFATEGVWMPASYAKLTKITRSVLSYNYNNRRTSLIDLSEFDEKDLYADTNNLKYSQGGLKFSGTAGAFDWGVSYYMGRYKQPSANLDKTLLPIATALKYKEAAEKYVDAAKTAGEAAVKAGATGNLTAAAEYQAASNNYKKLAMEAAANAQNAVAYIGLPSLDYDRKQTAGFEFATIIGRFNLRGEAGFNVTEDWDGDNPWVHNNSVQWLFGFDFDLPISNLNVNIQETGTYILNSGEIKDGQFKEFDVDYDPKDRYTNDKLVINISDSWWNDRFKPEMTLMWGIERGDFVFQPKLTYAPNPNLSFTLSGMLLYAQDEYSEFYSWKNNNFVNLGVKFEF